MSMWFRERKTLLKFVAWPTKTPTGDRFRDWLNGFETDNATRFVGESQELSEEIKATGFGPECHLDESDPNYQTRTVV